MAVLLSASSVFAADLPQDAPAPTVFGIKLGSSSKEVQAARQYAESIACTRDSHGRICTDDKVVGDIPTRDHWVFDKEGTLVDLAMEFKMSSYSDMRTIFIQKFGQPTSSEKVTWKNQEGASFDFASDRWIGRTMIVTLSEYSPDLTTKYETAGVAHFSLRAKYDAERAAHEAAMQKAVNDF